MEGFPIFQGQSQGNRISNKDSQGPGFVPWKLRRRSKRLPIPELSAVNHCAPLPHSHLLLPSLSSPDLLLTVKFSANNPAHLCAPAYEWNSGRRSVPDGALQWFNSAAEHRAREDGRRAVGCGRESSADLVEPSSFLFLSPFDSHLLSLSATLSHKTNPGFLFGFLFVSQRCVGAELRSVFPLVPPLAFSSTQVEPFQTLPFAFRICRYGG